MLVFYLPDVTLGKYHGATTMGTQYSEEEKAYRRGFDQGIAYLLYDIGLTNKQVQDIPYKRKVSAWRHFRAIFRNLYRDPAPRMSDQQKIDIRNLLRQHLSEAQENNQDA